MRRTLEWTKLSISNDQLVDPKRLYHVLITSDLSSTDSTDLTPVFAQPSPRLHVKMDHEVLDKTTSSSLILPKDDNKMVIISPSNGKFLIREDTVLEGCVGCGRAQFTCTGIKKQWSVLCWGQQMGRRYYLCKYFVPTYHMFT